ncbi:30S ribosomal protein S9 [bacterium]|nr:30S ribosomal protein S9 [bacterium]NCQ55304.1 30S ribosomal protein S9 [Candidatus Parcubacteria bacterium]NCS67183.1 30S ribosomal protein S9 [Candidatus Peregrinibacteria bacterium]NCS96809.1 30S ribosomal protein S9 [bacterium]
MAKGAYFYANGKRKNAIATVRLYPEGQGELSVNGVKLREWADDEHMVFTVNQPLETLSAKKEVDIEIITRGGGKKAQAEAIRLGIARAFVKKDMTLREQLKAEHFLTRDSRVKERKKPGLRGARRSPQWSKR